MQLLTTGGPIASHRGVYEVSLRTDATLHDPFIDIDLKVRFVRPDGSEVTVDGFYDGDGTFAARAYCDTIGDWNWESNADQLELTDSGSFEVVPSHFPGKLRRHSDDARRLRYDDGEWFLHVGDTGYRFPVDTEPEWQEYLEGAIRKGVTKIRTWFARSRHGVKALFSDDESTTLNLAYWKEIDHRFRYALERYPHLQFQVIPFAEDGETLRSYEDNPSVEFAGRYSQARFSAFPNVYWCLANDVKVIEGDVDSEVVESKARAQEGVSKTTIDTIGSDFGEREPWGTLITSHQLRTTGYDFVDAEWSDLVTLHDLDQADGGRIREYIGRAGSPVLLDEDRYERYREPVNPRYFFRRLFWVSLFSGGHPTYGGNRTYEPYDGDEQGLRGYDDSGLEGMDDFKWIHAFFRESELSLVGLAHDLGIVSDTPDQVVCCHDERVFLAYFANPDDNDPKITDYSTTTQSASFDLPRGQFRTRWYDPRTGEWIDRDSTNGGRQRFTTPDGGDWVLTLERCRVPL